MIFADSSKCHVEKTFTSLQLLPGSHHILSREHKHNAQMVEIRIFWGVIDSSLLRAKNHMEPGKEQGEGEERPNELRKYFMHEDLTTKHSIFN